MKQRRVISGIKPTGRPHLGNYLGMLKQSIALQQERGYECLYFIADLHALTIRHNPKTFAQLTIAVTMDCLALGLDPTRATIFLQSQVPEHTELAWLLDTVTPVGELERMTQFKEQAHEHRDNVNMGLLNYPVLMAADVLLYKGEFVPVGDDQVQHLELTRMIARKFNRLYGQTFPEPKPRLVQAERLRSLTDPTKKMSKSHGEKSYIALTDEPDAIRKKIARAVTATSGGKKMDPGVENLFAIMAAVSAPSTVERFTEEQKKGGIRYADLKKQLAEDLLEHLAPFQKRRAELEKKPLFVHEVLEEGRRKAAAIAQQTMEEVREKVGLLR